MTGNADASYDGERQEKAARKVGDSWEAATGSRKHTAALGSAQTYTFWDMKTDLLSSDSAPPRCLTLFPSYLIERQRCSRILRRRCMLP